MDNTADKKVKIYVVGHKVFQMPTDLGLFQPIAVGKKDFELPEGWLRDDTGENIADKNPRYNELTGLYWIWKNSDADMVGLCHYRRYFSTPQGKLVNLLSGKISNLIDVTYITRKLEKADIILHNKSFMKQGNLESLIITENDSEEAKKSKLSREVIEVSTKTFEKVYPEDTQVYRSVMSVKSAHLLNVMICKKELLDRYCEWLFPLLFEIEKAIDEAFPGMEHNRALGLLAERLLDVWVKKENLRIAECFTVNTERVDWKPW